MRYKYIVLTELHLPSCFRISDSKQSPDHIHDLDGIVCILFVLELYKAVPVALNVDIYTFYLNEFTNLGYLKELT